MSRLMERRAQQAGVTFIEAQTVFDLSKEDRRLFDAVTAQSPNLHSTFSFLQSQQPLPRDAQPTLNTHFYRLPGHNRSYCFSLTETAELFAGPVIVFKGSEPLLQDFATLVEWMLQAPIRRSTRVMADHFPLDEGKIPGALSLKEGLREAQVALDVQRRHLEHYNELAKLPTPLLIYALRDAQVAECRTILQRKISLSAFEKIEPLLDDGLATYVYYYPSAPIRANYWGGMGSPQLTDHIKRHLNADSAATGWVSLLVRLLYLGLLPYSVRNEGLGACMDPGNAALDGGFCDPDSIIPIDVSADDEFFRESVIQSLAILQDTIEVLVGASLRPHLYPSIERFVCAQYLRELVQRAITSEMRPHLSLDSRFFDLMSPKSIADVKTAIARKNRVNSYSHFVKTRGPL